MKQTITIIIVVVVLLGGLFILSKNSETKEPIEKGELISQDGVHWHPTLKIFINGEEEIIPPNIGLIGGHSPMHTHDPDGVIHLEFGGVVYEKDTRLENFFNLWKKDFNSEQILDSVNGVDGQVKMFVNSEENFEFENYLLQEFDKVEIRFE